MNKVVIIQTSDKKEIKINGTVMQGVTGFVLANDSDKSTRLFLDLEVAEFQITYDNNAKTEGCCDFEPAAKEVCKSCSEIEIGEKVKQLRLKANLTQKELAEKIGLKTGEAICQYESGKRTPPSGMLPEIAKALNCEISDLFEDTTKKVR